MPFTELTLTTIDEAPGFFKIEKDVVYYFDEGCESVSSYTVRKGFITDLASIPRLFRVFFSKVGVSRKPAVFHDDMYKKKWRTRKECDDLFYKMLLERGMGKFQAYLFYQAVRKFGWTRGNW